MTPLRKYVKNLEALRETYTAIATSSQFGLSAQIPDLPVSKFSGIWVNWHLHVFEDVYPPRIQLQLLQRFLCKQGSKCLFLLVALIVSLHRKTCVYVFFPYRFSGFQDSALIRKNRGNPGNFPPAPPPPSTQPQGTTTQISSAQLIQPQRVSRYQGYNLNSREA